MDKLKVKDLKLIIKKYKKEKPISGMKKEELKEYVEHLKKNGKLICVGNCKRGNCSCTLEGSGVLDLFKSQKLELSNTAKGIIAKSGNLIIRKIKLFTEEVAGISHASANIATLGALTKFTNKTGTKLFHIGCIITLSDGKELKFEKEEIPMLLTNASIGANAKTMDVPLKGKYITLRNLIANTEKFMTPEKFYKYEGLKNNCQDMMMGMLKGNKLETPELIKWGKQDITELINEVPTVNEKIMNGITGLKAKIRSVTGYGKTPPSDFEKKNEEIKQALNKNKNIQTADFIADKKKQHDVNTENAISFLLAHPITLKRENLVKLPEEELMNLFWAEYAIYLQGVRKTQGFEYDDLKKSYSMNGETFQEKDEKGMDAAFGLMNIKKLREAQGFVYNKATKDFTFEGKKYPQDNEKSMSDAFQNYFNRVDIENSCAYTLGEYAYSYGYSYDEDNKKWFMINPHLGIRQYIDDINQAHAMGNPNYSHPPDIWKSAFNMSYQLAKKENSYWDNKYHAYKKYSKDLMSSIDDFTGGIFSQVLSLAPPPFNAGVKLLQGLSKFMTGSETGDILGLVQSVDFKNLKKLAGSGKYENEVRKAMTLRCQLSNSLGNKKLSDKEIIDHLERLHGSGMFKDMFKAVVHKAKEILLPPKQHETYKSGPLVPDTKILYQMAAASYSTEPADIAPYVRVLKTPYLTAYRDARTLVLAVRGTNVKDSKDLLADISIAIGELKSSERYKTDIIEIRKLKSHPELKKLYWIGTGHSLGSALIDEFLNEGLISEAVTFNGAVSKTYYNSNNKNRRIYMSNDPLYLLMGRNTKYHEVRENKDVQINKAHSLSNFVGGRKIKQ